MYSGESTDKPLKTGLLGGLIDVRRGDDDNSDEEDKAVKAVPQEASKFEETTPVILKAEQYQDDEDKAVWATAPTAPTHSTLKNPSKTIKRKPTAKSLKGKSATAKRKTTTTTDITLQAEDTVNPSTC